EHAQLGALQRALWAFAARVDRQDSGSGSTDCRSDACGRDRSAEEAEITTCKKSGRDFLDRGKTSVSELQAVAVLRYACALFQSHSCKRARRADIRTCPLECSGGRQRHDSPESSGCL